MEFSLKKEDLPHYTYEDYSKWEGKWELIQGIPYAMNSPRINHQKVSFKIAKQLDQLLQGSKSCESIMAIDWKIVEDTVVQPDNIVICGENKDEAKVIIPPVLVFEILSPSTTRTDKILKYQIYQEAGVKYYCIVDPVSKGVDVFNMIGERFKMMEIAEPGYFTFDLGPCVIAFNCIEIFDHL